jgi:hypothetical protein
MISLEAAKRIEAYDFSSITDRKISVLEMFEHDCMDLLLKNVHVIFNCIWCCIKPQADAQNVDVADFNESIGGEALEAGQEVWRLELADFSRKVRTALLNVITAEAAAVAKVQTRLNKASEEAAQAMDREAEATIRKLEKDLLAGVTSG